MKKKSSIRTLLVLLCMAVFCTVPAQAMEIRASERIYHSVVTLSKKSDGNLSIYFSVRATGAMDVIGASSVEIQRNTITGWVTEYTFTPDNTPGIQAKGKTRHSDTLVYSPLFTGKDYRAVVMIYAEDASGASTKQLMSKTIAV